MTDVGELATKKDLLSLKEDFDDLKKDFEGMKQDMKDMEERLTDKITHASKEAAKEIVPTLVDQVLKSEFFDKIVEKNVNKAIDDLEITAKRKSA